MEENENEFILALHGKIVVQEIKLTFLQT